MSYRRKENKPDNGMGKIEFTMSSTFPLGTIPKVQFSKFCQDYNPKTYVNVLQKMLGGKGDCPTTLSWTAYSQTLFHKKSYNPWVY